MDSELRFSPYFPSLYAISFLCCRFYGLPGVPPDDSLRRLMEKQASA